MRRFAAAQALIEIAFSELSQEHQILANRIPGGCDSSAAAKSPESKYCDPTRMSPNAGDRQSKQSG